MMKNNIYTSTNTSISYATTFSNQEDYFESLKEEMTNFVQNFNSLYIDEFMIGDNIMNVSEIESLKQDLKKMHIKIALTRTKPTKKHLTNLDAVPLFSIRVKISNTRLPIKTEISTPLSSIKNIMTKKLEQYTFKTLKKNPFGQIKTENLLYWEIVILYINELNLAYYIEYETYSYLLLNTYERMNKNDNYQYFL